MNPLKSFGLNGHREFQTGDIYVRQSKAEQWLRLISILMNANWHICYGGLAVQTLQLAWLINYPPAGGSLEMEAGEWAGGVWMGGLRKGDGRTEKKKNKQKTVLSLHSVNVISYLLLYESGEIAESHFTQRRLLFLQTFLKNERFKLHLKKLWFLSLNDFWLFDGINNFQRADQRSDRSDQVLRLKLKKYITLANVLTKSGCGSGFV